MARFVWVFPGTYLPRCLPSIGKVETRPPVRNVVIVAWAGMRGAVSLAAALSLPVDFPERDLLLFLAVLVILVTLVGQGLTLAPLLAARWHLATSSSARRTWRDRRPTRPRSRSWSARAGTWPEHRPLIDTWPSAIEHRAEHLGGNGEEVTEAEQERLEHLAIMRSVLSAEREAVIGLRDAGQINDEVLREIERELDLEELRLSAEA